MKRAALALLLLSGCSVMDYSRAPPSDWPALTVTVERMAFGPLQAKCGGNLFVQVLACPWVNFTARTCVIYTSTDDEAVLDHERDHCRGYNHVGDSRVSDMWRHWKAYMANPSAYSRVK